MQRENINIFFTGDDPSDRVFAIQIEAHAKRYTIVNLCDVDEFDRLDDLNDQRSEHYPGVAIYILSPRMIGQRHNRIKLLRASPTAGIIPGRQAYFICRGITREALKAGYPDLQPLFDNFMIQQENNLPDLLTELETYVLSIEEQMGPEFEFTLLTRLMILLQVPFLIPLVALPANFFYYASFLAALILSFSGLAAFDEQSCRLLSMWVFYGAGFSVTRLNTLDGWLFLKSRWRLTSAFGTSHADHRFLASWYAYVLKNRYIRLAALIILLLPGMYGMAQHTLPALTTALVPFGVGIIFPSLFYWATNLIRETAYWSKGLTAAELDRTERFFLRTELEMSHIMRSGTVRRAWFPKPDRVFISHAWDDAERYQDAAQLLATICDLGGTSCFFDRQNIAQKFAAWRLQIVPHLLRCTHFFIVIGPDILKGDVVLRELKTAIQRWGTEVYPAIICVVDEDVVEVLLTNEDLPRDLRFVLTECPQLSLKDASYDEIVEYVIEQRRFQGMFEDWKTLFNPRATYERLVISVLETNQL